MKRVYLFPNIVTAFGLACGLFVILKVCLAGPGASYEQLLLSSSILLLIAALADVLDGAVARLMKAESEFGMIFDSLADAINFGVAPSVLMLKGLELQEGSKLLFFAISSAMIYAICGVLRLVRYSVMSSKAKKEEAAANVPSGHFTGLPIPAAAAAAVSLNLFLTSNDLPQNWMPSSDARAWILITCMVVLGYFMVSRWKFPGVKALRFKLPAFYLILAAGVGAVFILYGALYHFSFIFVVFAWLYIVVAWAIAIIRLIAGRKSATLAEFEPDPEDDE